MKIFIFIFLIPFSIFSQGEKEDNLACEYFRDKIVLYTDFGYNSAPFTMKYPFSNNTRALHYKNNYSPSLGMGIAYKWFSLRLNFALKGTKRAVSRYGNTQSLDLGLNFQVKNIFFETDLRVYEGYAIKDAYLFNPTLNALKPNEIMGTLRTTSLSLNAWYFRNKDFSMRAVFGKTGHYRRSLGTWYVKPTVALHGVNNGNKAIVSPFAINPVDTKTSALGIASLDLGLVPGYAYVERYKNWQFCGFLGLGAVIQAKSYNLGPTARGFLGLAPRYDIRFVGGYSVPKFFVFLTTDFDNKSIRFNNFKYRQAYYSIRISAGYRFNKKDRQR